MENCRKNLDINCEIKKTPDGIRVRVHIDALKPYWGEVPELRAENQDTPQEGTGDSQVVLRPPPNFEV